MNFSLKYLVPVLVLLIGLITMGVNMYFYKKTEHHHQIETEKKRISIIGNRISNEIERQKLYQKKELAALTRLLSQYTLDHLNSVKIYNEQSSIIFESIPVKFLNADIIHEKKIIDLVIKEQKATLISGHDEMYINALFPLAMKLKEGDLYPKYYGAIYLQFDMSEAHHNINDGIYKYMIINSLVILLMVAILALLIYFLILRRLDLLHKMTIQLSKGDYDARVYSCMNDELGEVNTAFNNMAEKISTHQKELEKKVEKAVEKNIQQNRLMMQQNRLVAMGEMINNIAHQWRQPLNSLGLIIQKFEFFKEQGILDDEKIQDNVSKGMLQIKKMSSTIDDFRNFFKQDKEMHVFYMQDLIDESIVFMENVLEEHSIEITSKIETSTQIRAYKNELIQVMINLINNAKDALVENRETDRKIHICCYVENERMLLAVKDNAGGVPEEIIDQIFDPYFSTKEEGKGTGIGLYMSKTIIEENMKGKLEVANENGGAVFIVSLSIDHTKPFCEVHKLNIHCEG